jgi:hypothetical protein
MIMMARKNSTYQFVAMLLQFNFDVSVSRTTEGDDVPDLLNIFTERTKESSTMSVYGSLDIAGSTLFYADELKKDIADYMAIVNYNDGNLSIFRRDFFLKNIKQLVKDGAISKIDDPKAEAGWSIYSSAMSGLFKLHERGDELDYALWEHEGRMVYMLQRLEFNSYKGKVNV